MPGAGRRAASAQACDALAAHVRAGVGRGVGEGGAGFAEQSDPGQRFAHRWKGADGRQEAFAAAGGKGQRNTFPESSSALGDFGKVTISVSMNFLFQTEAERLRVSDQAKGPDCSQQQYAAGP